MKLISLTQGKFAQVDDEDYEWLNQFKWHAHKDKSTFYAMGYINGKNTLMHRLILKITNPKIQGDHRDRNVLNNQRNNIRIATHSQNKVNGVSYKNSSSKFRGVGLYKMNNGFKDYEYWRASIQKDGKLMRLGLFKNETDAAMAYNKKATELFGEFANLNIIK
jgi:hypothetical protein